MSGVREELKKIATETAQRSGVRAISFRDLGNAVGIKSSSVIYHFENKDGLLYEIAKDYSDGFFARLESIDVARRRAPADKLIALVNIFLEALNHQKLCLCGMLSCDTNELDDRTRAVVQRFFVRLERWVAAVLRELGSSEAEARTMAPVVVSNLEGAMLLDKLDGGQRRLNEALGWVRGLAA